MRVARKLALIKREVIEGYRNGSTLEELAKLNNCSVGTVRNVLVAENEPRRKAGRRKGVTNGTNGQASEPNAI